MIKFDAMELSRTYTYPDGAKVTVNNITHLAVRPSGNHRLIAEDGTLHIIAAGWIHIEMKGSVSHFVI